MIHQIFERMPVEMLVKRRFILKMDRVIVVFTFLHYEVIFEHLSYLCAGNVFCAVSSFFLYLYYIEICRCVNCHIKIDRDFLPGSVDGD